MPDRIGNAALIWSATSDASGQRVHLLQAPLRAIKAGHSMETFQRQSLDRSVLENVAIGDGSGELRGRVRYDHDPVGLSDALVAGSQGKTLRYIPDLTDPDVDFNCDLVAPLAPFGLELDQQRGILGDQSVELVLRLTDQGSFDPLYHGSAVLFSYRAGGSLEASSSFGRITNSTAPATFADIASGGGFGNLSTALSNQARIHWMSTDPAVGPRTFPTLLLEDTRDNGFTKAEELDDPAWTKTRATVSANATTAPDGLTTADKLVEDGTASNSHEFNRLTPALTDDTQQSFSVFAKSAGRTEIQIVGFQKDGTDADVWFDLSAGTVGTASGGAVGLIEKYADDSYRCMIMYDSANGGSTPLIRVRLGSGSETNSYNGDSSSGVFFWGMQFEADKPTVSSYIPTSGAVLTRNADVLPLPFPARPQAMTGYLRFVEMGTILSVAGTRIFSIGDASANPRFRLEKSTTPLVYELKHFNTQGQQANVTLAAGPSIGDVVELVCQLNADGSVKLIQSINSAATTETATSGAVVLGQAWSEAILYLNSVQAVAIGFIAFRNLVFHRGVQSLATMRRVAGVT